MPGSAEELIRAGRIRELRGIGEGIASKLEELVVTGGIAELRALEAETAPELVGYGRLLGLTPKRMREVSRALDVKTPTEFRTAVASGRLRDVHGVGQATETKIRAALERKQPK
jgi:DNA polymerase (family 10)